MERIILHADMDAFFATVAQIEVPAYRGKPVIVGGTGRRAVVASASYEARRHGVRSGMPTWKARQLCPDGIFAPVNTILCQELSLQAFAIYQRYTPRLEPVSVDEACLDITFSRRLFGSPENIARSIKRTIREKLDLTVSVGIGPNRLVAKMAAEWQKPDGLFIITPDQLPHIFAPLPVGKIWGVGPATVQRLNHMGVETVGQLAQLPLEALTGEFGVIGRRLYDSARGIDETPVPIYDGRREYKSMSEEITLEKDSNERNEIILILLRLCDNMARRLRHEGYLARTVAVKLRFADFDTQIRSSVLKRPSDDEIMLCKAARRLLRGWLAGIKPVRLVGLGVSTVTPGDTPHQYNLFEDAIQRRDTLNRTRDILLQRFGESALERASLLDHPMPPRFL